MVKGTLCCGTYLQDANIPHHAAFSQQQCLSTFAHRTWHTQSQLGTPRSGPSSGFLDLSALQIRHILAYPIYMIAGFAYQGVHVGPSPGARIVLQRDGFARIVLLILLFR